MAAVISASVAFQNVPSAKTTPMTSVSMKAADAFCSRIGSFNSKLCPDPTLFRDAV